MPYLLDMPSKYRPPEARKASLEDAFPALRLQWAVAEASRCLMCDDPPCQKGCLADVDIKKFIRAVKTRNMRTAVSAIRDNNFLVATCGRVCPQGELCEKRCSAKGLERPIAIGELQRFVGETAIKDRIRPVFPEVKSRGEVAVVGGGPAGLSAAYYLRRQGIVVDVYERKAVLGGIPMTGIPRFRLPREVLSWEIGFLEEAGIRVFHEEVGDLGAVLSRYRAVFLGTGLGPARGLGVPGEGLSGVHQADALLEHANLDVTPPVFTGTTVVLGGGNTAMDAAATALRLGSSRVVVAYRRGDVEMPAWAEHRAFASEEGVELRFLLVPVEVEEASGHVHAVRFQEARLGDPDASGRRQAVPVEGAFQTIACDQVVLALGNRVDETWRSLGLEVGTGGPRVDAQTMETSRAGLFAGGDLVHGGATVVQAVVDGRKAAVAITQRILSH
jgi:glutamate synthase (NADPH/NADH) small chain